jgi:hypothetical protein
MMDQEYPTKFEKTIQKIINYKAIQFKKSKWYTDYEIKSYPPQNIHKDYLGHLVLPY